MKNNFSVPVSMLGQSGARFVFGELVVYLDPYLSNSVQKLEAPDCIRLLPIPISPETIKDANWVLLTHEHIDHCDPHTIPVIAQASPQAHFVGPPPVVQRLLEWGISPGRIVLANEVWMDIGPGLQIRAMPAAHPVVARDGHGFLLSVGYLFDFQGKRIYVAGDTFVCDELIETLRLCQPIHTAFLPVNEHNFFRNRRGILGNMSVREAFEFAGELGFQQVVATHWDMFALNSVDPDEIRLIHQKMQSQFELLLRPTTLSLSDVQISIVIRTLNEERYLAAVLSGVATQQTEGLGCEVIVVDSGSTDRTLEIAEQFGCRICHIDRESFSFGRSLNLGCELAQGDVVVVVSGHCVPVNERWLDHLVRPILDGKADYVYGRQLGGQQTRFSEGRIFAKFFPRHSSLPQQGIFCNNANSALRRDVWNAYRFDEELTGLEDMDLAQRLVRDGGRLGYVAEAEVFHYHHETWQQVRRRFEREAIALQKIKPHIHMTFFHMTRYIASSVCKDWVSAWRAGVWREHAWQVVRYRWNQYWGAFKGHCEHRKLSGVEREKYFYPD